MSDSPGRLANSFGFDALLDTLLKPGHVRGGLLPRWAASPVGHAATPAESFSDADVLPGDLSSVRGLGVGGRDGQLMVPSVSPDLDLWNEGDPSELRELAAAARVEPPSNDPSPAATGPLGSVDAFAALAETHDSLLRARAAASAPGSHTVPAGEGGGASDTLAFYRSPRYLPYSMAQLPVELEAHGYAAHWGIYLHSYGVENLARGISICHSVTSPPRPSPWPSGT